MSELSRAGVCVGFDIGATNMRVARLHADGIDEPRKRLTPSNAEEGMQLLATLIRECAGGEPLAGIAGGVPAVVAGGRMYRAPNQEGWTNFDVHGALLRELGVSAAVHNDADLAALGEAVYGAGRGKRIVAYVGVGTGIGTARVVDGSIDEGVYDFEAGHQIVDVSTGKTLEELASGGAFTKRFGAHSREVPRAEYEHITLVLSAGIYNIILHWSPEVVVLGGSMILHAVNGYRKDDIISALGKFPMVYPTLPEVRLAEFKDDAGLHGARALLCLAGAP